MILFDLIYRRGRFDSSGRRWLLEEADQVAQNGHSELLILIQQFRSRADKHFCTTPSFIRHKEFHFISNMKHREMIALGLNIFFIFCNAVIKSVSRPHIVWFNHNLLVSYHVAYWKFATMCWAFEYSASFSEIWNWSLQSY